MMLVRLNDEQIGGSKECQWKSINECDSYEGSQIQMDGQWHLQIMPILHIEARTQDHWRVKDLPHFIQCSRFMIQFLECGGMSGALDTVRMNIQFS